MNDLEKDPLWQDYQRTCQEFQEALRTREEIERESLARFSDEALRHWDDAHRAEEKSYEQVKAAERTVWARFHNS